MSELLDKWKRAHEKLDEAKKAIDDFQAVIRDMQEKFTRQVETLKWPSIPNLDVEAVKKFMQQPYLLLPRKGNSWYVIVPRFVDMQVGWLEYQTPSFNVFVINKYVRWLTPLPSDIESRLGMQPTAKVQVVDGLLKPAAGMEDEAWRRYRKYLVKREKFGIRIKKGYERHLLSALIRDGYLPFTPRPVDPEDLGSFPEGFEMEPHQKEAYDAFLKWGSIGIYWPAGQGKTFFGAALCKLIKGPKLVVVPNVSEREQWSLYLRRFGVYDVDLLTYQSFHKTKKYYKFIVYDECHRLPAPRWSRFATVDSKYRLGLSACVAKGTRILCNDDWRNVETLIGKTTAIYGLGEKFEFQKQQANVFHSNWSNRYLIEVGTDARSVKVTNDHPFITYRNYRAMFVRADELKIGDMVCVGSLLPLNRKMELYRLFGFAYGDANLRRKNDRFTFTVNSAELKLLESVLNRLGYRYRADKKKGKDAFNVEVWNLGEKFAGMGYPRGRKTEQTINFPNIPESAEIPFLSGLFGAEGTPPYLRKRKANYSSYYIDGGIALSMNTVKEAYLKPFFEHVSFLLTKYGVQHRIIKRKGWKRTSGIQTINFQIVIKGNLKNIIHFLQIFEFAYSPEKQRKANKTLAYALRKIQMLNERKKLIETGSPLIPKTTIHAWLHGYRHYPELRNTTIDVPATSPYIKWEQVSALTRLKEKPMIFDVNAPKTQTFVANGFVTHNTPYREDGREDLIIALTGYPVGLSWEHFLRVKAIRKPKITVKVVNNDREKMSVLEEMLKVPMKTLIFVELIASGEKISKHFNLPFVYGNTKDRLEIIKNNLVTVVSRVGDEGISIKDLERTIEVEFLGASRRQEAQRAYRLLHSVKPEISHTVIMTVKELDQFSRRFLALEEKGFQVEYVS